MSSYRISFINEKREISVNGGITLLEAQIIAGLHPDAPCGGKGTCGKCLVEVRRAGEAEWKKLLACSEKVECDLEVRTMQAASGVKILAEADDAAQAWNPWVHLEKIECGEADLKARLQAVSGAEEIDPELITRTEKFAAGEIYAVIASGKVMDILPEGRDAYMAAFDIGTTTIAAYMISLREKKTVAVASMLNPQIQFGADVISRANHTLENGVNELRDTVRAALDELIGNMCTQVQAERDQVYAVSAVGNTCMHHLLLGVELHTLVRAPYDPAVREAMVLAAAEYGLKVHPGAQLLLQPVIAGFVGADTVACLVSGNWREREKCTLLIDIGTNGEMVLGDSKRRIACSTAAGPALEGAKIECGMRGGEGAVDHVWLEGEEIRWHVIGDGKAKGICGSGLVDLIAVLLKRGDIDETGRFQEGNKCELGESGVVLTQKDVREVQLAKGAIAAGIQLMSKKMGISLADIEEVHIAGAFGSYMDPDSACAIGLIPAELRQKIHIIGNAAGKGAQRVLTDRCAWENAIFLAENTEFLELASMPEFQDVFVDELEFPEYD